MNRLEVKDVRGESGINLERTQLLPWGALSAKTGSAPSVLWGRGVACKKRCFVVCMFVIEGRCWMMLMMRDAPNIAVSNSRLTL